LSRKWFVLLIFALFLVITHLSSAGVVVAQDAVPREILERSFLIKVGAEGGTAFKIDYGGKIYLVTARHVAADLRPSNATIQIWRAGKWEDLHIVKTLLPPSKDADIAVLETDEKASQPFEVAILGDRDGPSLGQQVWFLGYPFGDAKLMTHSANGFVFPFVKRGTISAIDARIPSAVVFYIDGWNNPGFSGGPIIYWDFNNHAYRILGVVSGYRFDAAHTLVRGKPGPSHVLVNSGILISYSIKHAVEAIEASQK
jgi:S1-C subfamily serine protease